jgi:hypothetical protein
MKRKKKQTGTCHECAFYFSPRCASRVEYRCTPKPEDWCSKFRKTIPDGGMIAAEGGAHV